MADYAKLYCDLIYSVNSDYSSPELETNLAEYEVTPDEHRSFRLEVDNSAVSLDLTDFASVTVFLYKNLSTTIDVTVAWTDTDANSNTQRVPPGGFLALSDIDPATNPTFVTDSSTALGRLAVVGS